MNVELVSIGDELLLGYTTDTNAGFFARSAAAEGIRVVRGATVADTADEIADAVREALDRTGAVVTSGGLGPTSDDLTKPSIAELFDRGMTLDEGIWKSLRARWTARGWPGEIPLANRSQAMIPAGATVLTNRHGSAPGIWLEDNDGRWVAMLPGVPSEFRGMTTDELIPHIVARMAGRGGQGLVVRSRTLRTNGIAESALADALGKLAMDPMGVSLAYLPGWEGVDLRLTVRDVPAVEADERLEVATAALRARIGRWVYGEGDADLAELALQALRAKGYRIAVAESCTGGMLGMRITAISGSSDVMVGGVISYDNAVKVQQLGVRVTTLRAHGAVSEETAREMASGVRARLGVDVGVSVTGVAGPGGGTPEKPVGTVWVAVDVRGEVQACRVSTIGDRHEIRQRSTQAALALTVRALGAPASTT